MSEADNGGAKPPIHMSTSDYDQIAEMALGLENSAPALAKLLFDEIDRAVIYPDGQLPADVVALGSEVEYEDQSTGAVRRVRLVLPHQADMEAGRVSILTPAGAGLIGMSVGRAIDWPCLDGRPRSLRILAVSQEQQS